MTRRKLTRKAAVTAGAVVTGLLIIGGVSYVITGRREGGVSEAEGKRASLLMLALADEGRAGLGPASALDVGYSNTRYKAWCQLWVLKVLRAAGLTSAKWKTGLGFVSTLKLPVVKAPKPGDLYYRDQPKQHMGFVVSGGPETDDLVTVDGAQEGDTVAVVRHEAGETQPIYYSIERLVRT